MLIPPDALRRRIESKLAALEALCRACKHFNKPLARCVGAAPLCIGPTVQCAMDILRGLLRAGGGD